MKYIRNLMFVLLALLLSANMMIVGAAENEEESWPVNGASQKLDIQKISVKKSGKIKLLVYSSADTLKESEVSAYFENEEVPVSSVAPYEDQTSWLFLVDTSSVGTDAGREPVIDTLRTLAGNMKEGEKGQILKNGDTEENINLISKDDLLSFINENPANAANYNSSAVNLMETVVEAVSYFADYRKTDHCVLVIISNGKMKSPSIFTSTEILSMIDESDITVYTVAYTSDADITQLQEYGSLALASCGGLAIEAPYDFAAADALGSIFNNEQHFYTLGLNPVKTGAVGELLTIKTVDGSEVTCSLEEEEISRITDKIKESQSEAETAGEETADMKSALEKETASDSDADSLLSKLGRINILPIALGAVLGIIVITAVILLIKRKKESAPAKKKTIASPVASNGPKTKTDVQVPSEPGKKRIQIYLSQANGEGQIYSDYLEDGELSVGSQSPDSRLVISVDPYISEKHMVIQYKNEKMYVIDCSRNGIWVDDNKIDGQIEIHQHALIRMGLMEFYITWRAKN